eukprot:464468-Rhodomonas_salina.1
MATKSYIEVTTSTPFRIQNASQDYLDLFQFSQDQINGRTVQVNCGPATRFADLQQAIDAAASGKHASAHVCLYSGAGTGKPMVVKAMPTNDTWEICRLTMVESDAVPMKEAMMMKDCSRAIVSLEKSPKIVHVNGSFGHEFGVEMTSPQKSLRFLHGPRTNGPALAKMLQEASGGLAQTQAIVVYTIDCEEKLCE